MHNPFVIVASNLISEIDFMEYANDFQKLFVQIFCNSL